MSFIGAAGDARVAILDVTPPVISAVTVPATALVGQAVPMTTAVGDAWSGLGTGQPSWSFGDGASGSGASVSHVFAAAGTYTVTTAASDAVGNAAAAVTHQIVVSKPVPPPPPPAPATTVGKPKVKASYVASHLVGSITLTGTAGATTSLTIAIIKHGAKKASATSAFAAKAGKWTRTVKLPPGLRPARYDVVVSGKGVRSSQTSFTIAPPASGIVSRAYASGPRRGPAVTTLTGSNELWAHFAFGSLPAKKQTITTQWTLPNGSKLGANTRPRTSLVEAQVKDLSGKPLPTGRWRCVIRAGGGVVATLSVRLK
jgi:PKD repeat protein